MTSRKRIYRVRLVGGEWEKASGLDTEQVEAGTAGAAAKRGRRNNIMMGWDEISDERRQREPHPWADAEVTDPDGKVRWFRYTEYG